MVNATVCNVRIRNAYKAAGLRQWELAKLLHTNEYSLSRKLREELTEEETNHILDVIENNKKGGKINDTDQRLQISGVRGFL